MSRRSSRARRAPPGLDALRPGVQHGLRQLVSNNVSTVCDMLDKPSGTDSEDLLKACAEVMGQQQLSPESFLGRFFSAAVLGAHCAKLGKSDKGNEATLAARASKEWRRPGFEGQQQQQQPQPQPQQPQQRQANKRQKVEAQPRSIAERAAELLVNVPASSAAVAEKAPDSASPIAAVPVDAIAATLDRIREKVTARASAAAAEAVARVDGGCKIEDLMVLPRNLPQAS